MSKPAKIAKYKKEASTFQKTSMNNLTTDSTTTTTTITPQNATIGKFTNDMSVMAKTFQKTNGKLPKLVEPIEICKPHTITEIRTLNERKLNALLPHLNVQDILRKPLPNASKDREPLQSKYDKFNKYKRKYHNKNDNETDNDSDDSTVAAVDDADHNKSKRNRNANLKPIEIPKNLKNAIISLRLFDEPIIENRIKIFIGYCKYKNYNYNTTARYFAILRRNGVFGTDETHSKLRPNKIAFIDCGRPHIRIVSMDDFRTFTKYILENLSQYSAPIAIAIYTGLRTSEILQFTTYTLYQLYEKHSPVAIKRKQTIVMANQPAPPIYWEPIYNTHLNSFIERLIVDIFQLEYDTFMRTKINTKLFHVTPKTLGNRIRSLYYDAVDKKAPLGFGIHSCRNMIAMLMAETSENILAIQTFLQHKDVNTTRHYIRADYTYTTAEFNRLTKYEFSNAIEKLQPPKDSI